MPTFPEVLDDFTPKTDGVDDVMAIDVNELQTAIEAIEAKVGADGSAVTTSHDYKIAQLESGKQDALGFTPENVTNKRTSFQATPDDTAYPSEKLVKDSLDAKASLTDVKTPPTDLKISTASKGGVLRNIDGAVGDVAQTASGWIEDEKFGWWHQEVTTPTSAEFDSAVTRTGRLTLLLQQLDTSSKCQATTLSTPAVASVAVPTLAKYGIPLKASTKYILKCYVKTSLVSADSVFLGLATYDATGTRLDNSLSSALSGTNDWTLLTITLTTNASTVWGAIAFLNYVEGAISDAWFDVNSMTLEEVVTDTTFTGKVAEKIRPVLQAVTSTDNIDQSLDPTGAYTNTYALTNAVNEGATHIQTFTPTKKYITQIGVWVVAKGTGNWTLAVHNAANNLLASQTIANDSLVDGAFNYFDVPNIWASGALHFHLYSSVADGTCKANTSNDLETASYIQNYAKKSENFSLIANGIKTDLKADKDGLLSNAIIDLDNGKYNFYSPIRDMVNDSSNDGLALSNVHSSSGDKIPNFSIYKAQAYRAYCIDSADIVAAATYGNVNIKVNTILPAKKIKAIFYTGRAGVKYSFDNVVYTDLLLRDTTHNLQREAVVEMNGNNIIYFKLWTSNSSQTYADIISLEADLDTSSIPQGLFYPLGVNQFAETWKATGTVLSYVYRKAKYTNENGVVMPAIELNSGATGAGTALGYIPLKIDNSQETTPAITIIASSGVASDTVLDADGEYVALSSGATEGVINYKVTITKNTLYLSSNGESVDSTQDPSHQANFIVGVRQQGLIDRVKDIGDETEDIKKGLADTKQLIRNNALTIGYDTGTTDDYAITLQDFAGYQTGLSVIFRANTANTGASTLNINGMGAKAIVKGVSTALSNNDILAGMFCSLVYDGTNFVLLNPRTL